MVLNALLSVNAFLGNILILFALHKESSLHPPSKLLLRCLAITDLCVGLTSEPLAVICWISVANGHWNMCRYTLPVGCATANIFCGVSVLTLTAISGDRLLALLLGLRYRQVVTLKRTFVIVITLWVLSALLSATNELNIARYKKAVSTAIWLQLTLVACYLPYGVVTALATSGGRSSSVSNAYYYVVSLVYLNSSLNPILYCWKIEEVRQGVKDTIRQVLFFCFSS